MSPQHLLQLAESCEQTAKRARQLHAELTTTAPQTPITLAPNLLARQSATAKFRNAREILKGVRL